MPCQGGIRTPSVSIMQSRRSHQLLLAGLLAMATAGCAVTRVVTPTPDVIPPGEPGGIPVGGAPQPVDGGMDPAYTPDPFEEWADRAFPDLGVVIELPAGWLPVDGEPYRVEGDTGFVHLNTLGTDSGVVEEVCRAEATHRLQPYGSTPSIAAVQVDGRVGCQITPSQDQMSEGNYSGALLIPAPEGVTVDVMSHVWLLINTDLAHLADLATAVHYA